ncbi:MAG: hypothetical protein DRO94_02025 [Candidatus Altiarchaeales archaeon]|nr:MAG: hypothetical protein DRO94_02025 [Candidatus Altiarchaeales archaeon]HDO82176.1 hypothetical protein [Candidatus Altiarchaeales archaeon]HEX54825.1 hypothetical protein [Candidatus Altiarchaeales archaeon]
MVEKTQGIQMNLINVIFSIIAGIMAFLAFLYSLRFYKNINSDEKYALVVLFTRKEARIAFKFLAFCGFFHGVSMVISAIGLQLQDPIISKFSKIGCIILMMGFLYFFFTLERITKK